MFNNTKLARWFVPGCLVILLALLILVINFTSSQSSRAADEHVSSVATTVAQLRQTVTTEVKGRENQQLSPSPTPTFCPTLTPEPTPNSTSMPKLLSCPTSTPKPSPCPAH